MYTFIHMSIFFFSEELAGKHLPVQHCPEDTGGFNHGFLRFHRPGFSFYEYHLLVSFMQATSIF